MSYAAAPALQLALAGTGCAGLWCGYTKSLLGDPWCFGSPRALLICP